MDFGIGEAGDGEGREEWVKKGGGPEGGDGKVLNR